MRFYLIRSLLLLAFLPQIALADSYLMYGPSLAVYIADNDLDEPCDEMRGVPCPLLAPNADSGERGGDLDSFTDDESHFATDAGHTVTIVSAAQWSAMTTEQFSAYDAIVIGDAGCDDDEGVLLEPVNANKMVWSPAVTGHLFLHTFDNVYHYNDNSPPDETRGGTSLEQFAAMVDLAVDGMEFAASAEGTGLYYANGCRDHDGGSGSGRGGSAQTATLEFLSELALVTLEVDRGGDNVAIMQPSHPSMVNVTDAALSDWGSSFHAVVLESSSFLQVIAIGDNEGGDRGGGGELPFEGPVVLASNAPLGSGGVSVLEIPTASDWALIGLIGLLGLAGLTVLSRRV